MPGRIGRAFGVLPCRLPHGGGFACQASLVSSTPSDAATTAANAATADTAEHRLPHGSFHIPKVTPEDRRRVLTSLHVLPEVGWAQRFVVMITLSALVAIMGLDADSPALVIGAMLIAPLMAPVLGLAANIAMALGRHATRSAFTVILSTAGVILLSYLVAKMLPNGELPGEVLARTRPDIRDLVVGLAAGAAGAYATVRSDMSSSLPGVAVAVALIPPLCVVGYTLEAGYPQFAQGAFLLYSANLAAIVFAGTVVFVITGLVPQRRLSTMTPWVAFGVFCAAVATLLIAIPLARTSSSALSNARVNQETYEAVIDWIGPLDLDIVGDIRIDGAMVEVSVEGPDQAAPTETLRQRLIPIIGADVDLDVRATQVTEVAPNAPVIEPPSDIEVFRDKVAGVVDAWLELEGGEEDLRISDLQIEADQVTGVVSGPFQPNNEVLESLLEEETGTQLLVKMQFDETQPLAVAEEVEPTEEELNLLQLRQVANLWAADTADSNNPIVINAVERTPAGVIVELTGPRAPRIDDLHNQLVEARGLSDPAIEIRYVPRRVLDTTPPTTLPPATTVAPDGDAPPDTTLPDATLPASPPTTGG